MQTFLVFGHGEPALWDDVKALLNSTTQRAIFAYTLRALTEEEDFEFELSWTSIGISGQSLS